MRLKIANKDISAYLMLILGVGLFLRCLSNVFIYPLFIFAVIVFIFAQFKTCLTLLFFLFPFANIIKLQPGQISLFTFLFVIFAVRVVLRKGALKRRFLFCVVLFAIYAFMFSGFGKFILIATMVCGFIMVHETCDSDDYDFKEVLFAFCFGLILSSTIGLFRESLPIVDSYITAISHKVDQGEYVERFLGLNSNPNYYSMDISVVLSCLAVIMIKEQKQGVSALLFVVLTVFGLMSVSKSFLISLIILFALLVGNGIKKGGKSFLKILFAFILIFLVVYYFAHDSIDTYFLRFDYSGSGDISEITTGRSDIWFKYLKAIVYDLKTLFLGHGVGSKILGYKAAHNTYIEGLYGLGLLGMLMFLIVMHTAITVKLQKYKYTNFIPILILLIRFFGIGLFFNDALWYYLMISCLLYKSDV